MARMENTKMTLSLDSETKRLLRNLTRAVDRLARTKWEETEGSSGVKRLSEPAEDTPKGYASGGYTGTGTKFTEPDREHYIPVNQVKLDPAAVQNLARSVLNQKSYLQ